METQSITRIFYVLLKLVIILFKTAFCIPPRTCRFYPSCSEYAIEAIKNQPFLYAIKSIIWRLLRCNPFVAGGFDPPMLLKVNKVNKIRRNSG